MEADGVSRDGGDAPPLIPHAALSVAAPLKTALTGLELLLARAQLWEDTAAAHVSLAAVLRPAASLAARWRSLELTSWRNLLDATIRRFAHGHPRSRSSSAELLSSLHCVACKKQMQRNVSNTIWT